MLTTKYATVIQSGGGISAAASQTAKVVANTSSPNSNAIEIILVAEPGVESLQADVIKSTKLIITGNETGGRVVIPVTIKRNV